MINGLKDFVEGLSAPEDEPAAWDSEATDLATNDNDATDQNANDGDRAKSGSAVGDSATSGATAGDSAASEPLGRDFSEPTPDAGGASIQDGQARYQRAQD